MIQRSVGRLGLAVFARLPPLARKRRTWESRELTTADDEYPHQAVDVALTLTIEDDDKPHDFKCVFVFKKTASLSAVCCSH